MESYCSICPGGCRLDGPVCVEPVSGWIGEPRRGADGPRCAHAFVGCPRLVCRHARRHYFYRRDARFGHVAGLVRARFTEETGQGRAASVADFGNGRETGHRCRRNASPGRGAGGSQPGVARDPGTRTLYRSRHLRGGRLREDLGVHAPVCPAIVRLASEEPEAAGGGSGPRSQGGFLLRHPGDSRKGGPGRRLHGT